MKFLVRIVRNGEIIAIIETSSRYDAKLRKRRLAEIYSDCTIEVCNGTPQIAQNSVDGQGAGI